MKPTDKILLGEGFYVNILDNEVVFENPDLEIKEFVPYDINTSYEEIMRDIRVLVEKHMSPDALVIYDKWMFLNKITNGNVGKMYEKGVAQ